MKERYRSWDNVLVLIYPTEAHGIKMKIHVIESDGENKEAN